MTDIKIGDEVEITGQFDDIKKGDRFIVLGVTQSNLIHFKKDVEFTLEAKHFKKVTTIPTSDIIAALYRTRRE